MPRISSSRGRIALVQNQSEMAHYGYADSQLLFERLGYEVRLFTSNNIARLDEYLDHEADALVLASNCLSDKATRAHFETEAFIGQLWSFLQRGKGLISFHQLGVAAQDRGLSSRLFSPASEIVPEVRPLSERSSDGILDVPDASRKHITLKYPNALKVADMQKALLAFRSLSGLYWHSWGSPSFSDWDVLITDSKHESRPLVIATKQSQPYRIILSSLTLDWQRYQPALENLLSYVVEKRHATAVVSDSTHRSASFDFMLSSLRSSRFPFAEYQLPGSLAPLREHVGNLVHSTVVLAPHVSWDRLDSVSQETLSSAVEQGDLRVIDAVEPVDGSAGYFALRNEVRYPTAILQRVELLVQAELRKGYVDGSFWSTADTLRTLESVATRQVDYVSVLEPTMARIDDHDRYGSYDEVFGATCAALWLRATYLGLEDPRTLSTVAWVRSNVARYEDRERTLAYWTLLSVGIATDEECANLSQVLSALDHDNLSPIDAVAYLRAAVALREVGSVPRLIASYVSSFERNEWIDLATVADAATVLLEACEKLEDEGESVGSTLRARVDDVVFTTVIRIQDSIGRHDATSSGYPWDGKASTAVKCLEAWIRFDEQQSLPVYDLMSALRESEAMTAERADGSHALAVLEDLKADTRGVASQLLDVQAQVNELAPKASAFHRAQSRLRWTMIAAGIAIYLLMSLLIGGVVAKTQLTEAAKAAFVDGWGFHLAVAGVIATLLGVPFIGGKLEGRREDASASHR